MLETVNVLFHTSFLDQDNVPHVLPEKTNHSLKLWLRLLIQNSKQFLQNFPYVCEVCLAFPDTSQEQEYKNNQ